MSWSPTLFAGRRYAVVGLGRNGLPAARALLAMGADIGVWDDRADMTGLPVHDPALGYGGFDALVLSPGIPHTLPAPHRAADAARAAGIPILSDAELLYQAVRASGSHARFVGVTGTNGKSTTTALVAHLLAHAGITVAAGGNLGTAALALPLLGNAGVYVLEMSSYMLERLDTLRFDVAALLNLSPDHLDRHGGMAGYVAAKRHIFDRVGTRVVGIDDPDTAALAPGAVTVSGHQPADVWCDDGVLTDAEGPILPMIEAPSLPGAHNAQNAAASAAIMHALGVPREGWAAGIAGFRGLPHRQQRVAQQDGIAWVNDSKGTNADATARALLCYDRMVWIVGGVAKAGGIDALRPLLPRVAHAVLIGQDAPLLAGTLRDAGVPFTHAGTLDAAVPVAGALARELGSGTVLLSPACASFDQFSGFEARGDRFRDLVHAATAAKGAH